MNFEFSGLFLRAYEGSDLSASSRLDSRGSLSVQPCTPLTPEGSKNDYNIDFHPHHTLQSAGLSVDFLVEGWSKEAFLLLPAAAYDSNRFETHVVKYSPKLPYSKVRQPNRPVLTDVMRFSDSQSRSRMECLTGDLSSPLLAVFCPETKHAWILRFPAFVDGSESGLCVEEDLEAATLRISVLFPGVRSKRYVHMDSRHESPDHGRNLVASKSVVATLSLSCEPAGSITELYDLIFEQRLEPSEPVNRSLPYSEAYRLVEEKYNRDAWAEEHLVYLSTAYPGTEQDPNPFQNGWCGGILALWSLIADGMDLSRGRSWKSFEHLTTDGISPSGLFYSKKLRDGSWAPDRWNPELDPELINTHLIRREGDNLLSTMKIALRMHREGDLLEGKIFKEVHRCLHTVCQVWKKNHDFGQWLNQDTFEIVWPGTACAGALPGALAIASKVFNRPLFLEVAVESMSLLERDFLETGLSYGGVGDALSVPDSESVGAMIESAMFLHAITGESRWLHTAELAVKQFATWVMDYDYSFPEDSEFGRLGLTTTGTVFANVQNKHSAPGICTHSGQGLLRLYRATGDTRYMDLLYSIAGAMPQFVSRADRPICTPDGKAMPSGWINERVNTSDWDFNRGGIFYGSCWCEMSLMLSYTELPGIYIDRDAGRFWTMEPVEVRLSENHVEIKNTSRWDARVKVLAEGESDRSVPLPLDSYFEVVLEIGAGETVRHMFTDTSILNKI